MSEKSKRFYPLDLLKFIAAILIVFHHYQQVREVTFENFNFYGGDIDFSFLVELFFIISGFVCESNLIKNKKLSLTDFAKKKLKRLYPMAILSVLFCVVFSLIGYKLGYSEKSLGLWQILTSMFLVFRGGAVKLKVIGVNNPIWYLSVLIICYFIYKIILEVSKRININSFWMFISMIILGIGIIDYKIEYPFLNYDVARGYIAFFLGVVLFRLNNEYKSFFKTLKNLTIPLLALVVLGSMLLDKFLDNQKYIYVFVVFPLIVLFFVNSEVINKLLNHSFVSWFGEVAFSVYIWHYPLLLIFRMWRNVLKLEIEYSEATMLIFTAITIIFSFVVIVIEKSVRNSLDKQKKSTAKIETPENVATDI